MIVNRRQILMSKVDPHAESDKGTNSELLSNCNIPKYNQDINHKASSA